MTDLSEGLPQELMPPRTTHSRSGTKGGRPGRKGGLDLCSVTILAQTSGGDPVSVFRGRGLSLPALKGSVAGSSAIVKQQ
jgi:hypothetical protein